MNCILRVFFLFFVLCLSHCRDFYMGMFKRNDFLVSQDRLYKEKVTFHRTVAKYGRVFKCPITFFRVVDRLGYGGGPNVEIIRGGLLKKFIVARLTSPYNMPISVNIYVGCENKRTTLKVVQTTAGGAPGAGGVTTPGEVGNSTAAGNGTDGGDVTTGGAGETAAAGEGGETTAAAAPEEGS